MENVSTLDMEPTGKDVAIPSPFAYGGDLMSFQALSAGIGDTYATPIEQGGEIFRRTTMNTIGLISTLDLFMSCIGSYASYVNGITYRRTAKLEFFDENGCMQTDVVAMSNGLGNFNSDSSLISDSSWRPLAGSAWRSLYFN